LCSQLFLYDTTFEIVVDKFGNNSFGMLSAIHGQGGLTLVGQYDNLIHTYNNYSEAEQFYLQNNLDTANMLNNHAEIFASLLYLYKNNIGFYNLSQGDQLTVITNVFNTLGNPDFRANNPNSPVVVAYNKILDRLGLISNSASRLTMEEVNECLKAAVIGAIVNSWNTIKQLWQVINGYNLGWSGIVNVAKSALRTIIGSSAAGALVGFALCIAWDFFW
jgi:hypothetical protein